MENQIIIDPLFQQETRSAVLPILYPTIHDLLIKQRGCFWQTHEVSLVNDLVDWNKLKEDERYFIKMVLAFFASSDIIVNKNLTERFTQEISIHEIQALYNYQKMMEDIHSEMYALLIETYITDNEERNHLFSAVETIPIIKKKAQWANHWMKSEEPFVNRLIAFAALEGIFFSGSFCAIYWIKERGVLPGLSLSNDFIARDEGLHVTSAVEIHNLLINKISQEKINEIFKSAVELEIEFICDALPCKLIGMNATLMSDYIKYVANRLAKSFGFSDVYENIVQPFTFMDMQSLIGKSNFFEQRASEYSKLANTKEAEDPYAF